MVKADTSIKIKEEMQISRKNESLLAKLLENSSQPFGVGYPDGRLGLVNKAFEELTGYSREELKNTDWSEILTPYKFRDMEKQKLVELQRTGQPMRYEKEYIRKDGTRVPIELLVHIVKNEDGSPEYYYSFITDISERKRSEKLKKELLEKEQQLTEELTVSNEELQSTSEELRVTNEELIYQGDELIKINKALEDSHERLNKSLEELRNTDTLLSSIMNLSSDVIYIKDLQSRWIFVNPALERIAGKTSDELLGKNDSEIYSNHEIGNAILENDRRIMDSGVEETLEEVVETPEGLSSFISVKTPRFNEKGQVIGIVGISHDITESKQAEKKLKESEQSYIELFNSMTEMFQIIELIYDKNNKPVDYYYIKVNPAFEKLVGKTKDQLINKRAKDIFGVVEDYWLEKYDEAVKTGNPLQFENYGAELDKWYQVNVWKVKENQVAIIFTDTTERKHREEKEKILIDELKRSNEELERFAYVSSHDLQEPLRMVTLYSQLLERRYKDNLDSDADDFIGYIVEGANRMRQLIDDLLEYSRVTSQAKEFENVDLEKILDIVLQNLSIHIQENNITISHDALPIIYANQNQMVQVFQNLITNSIKFKGQKPPEIHISAQKGVKEWKFAVQDNGIGIDPKHQKQIFEVFKRLHTKEEYPGTGIGLSITQKIILHHGGQIWAESELGKGSTFYFTIPTKN